MSWAELKKAVNSDFDIPLNHLIWLNDYKTYGTNSYVYNNKNLLYELYKDKKCSLYDFTIRQEAIAYLLSNGETLASILNFYDGSSYFGTASVSTIVSNKAMLQKIMSNPLLMYTCSINSDFKSKISSSSLLKTITPGSNITGNYTLVKSGNLYLQYVKAAYKWTAFTIWGKTDAMTNKEFELPSSEIYAGYTVNRFVKDLYLRNTGSTTLDVSAFSLKIIDLS